MMETAATRLEKVTKSWMVLYVVEMHYMLYLDCSVLVYLWRWAVFVMLATVVWPAGGATSGQLPFTLSASMKEPIANDDLWTRFVRSWILNFPVVVLHMGLYGHNFPTEVPGPTASTQLRGDNVEALEAWEAKLWSAKFLTFTAAAEPSSGYWLMVMDLLMIGLCVVIMTLAAALPSTPAKTPPVSHFQMLPTARERAEAAREARSPL